MEQKYNLKELFVLNSMHDLRVQQVELKKGVFILHYKKICQNKNIMFDSCDVIFNEVYDADVFAEVRKCNGLNVEGKIYYDLDFIEFINKHNYKIETKFFYYGYKSVIIQAALVNQDNYYCEDCIINVFSTEILYRWRKDS